uniref:Uncharacterized protein n=1 Tax=Setaria italica TaxID=4555 RepID=K3Y3S0_SETIT
MLRSKRINFFSYVGMLDSGCFVIAAYTDKGQIWIPVCFHQTSAFDL